MNPREQSLNQQLIGDSFFYLLNKIVPGLTGLISVIVFMRWVGPDGYGQLTLLLSFIMAVGALSSGWLIQAVLRYYTHDISSPEFSEAIRHGILISLLLGFVVLLTASIFFNEIDIFTFIIAYFSLSSIILFRLKATLLRAGLKAKQVTKMTCIQAILGIIIPVLILMGRNHYLSILAGIAIAYLVTGYNKNLLESKKSKNYLVHDNSILKKYYSFGIPISARMALGLFIPFLERWFIMFFFDNAITGYYASYSEIIVRVFSVILFPITLAIHPRATHLWNQGMEKESIHLIKKGIGIQTGIFSLSFLILIFLENEIFQLSTMLIPGLETQFMALGIPIFILGYLLQVSLLIHMPLELSEKPMKLVWSVGLALVIAVLGNLIFLPRFGVIATAYSSVASSIAYITGIFIFIKFDKKS